MKEDNVELKKEPVKKTIECLFEDTFDLVKYVGKIKSAEIENDDYVLTLYKKGSIYRKLRRIGFSDLSQGKEIKYREIV